jgi:hypothetical protein
MSGCAPLVILLEGDAARPDDADLEPSAGQRELVSELRRALARRGEIRRCRDRREVGREQSGQAAQITMEICFRQFLPARNEPVGDAHGLDQRQHLALAFDHKLAAQRLDLRQVARDPQRVAETLLDQQHEALAVIRGAAPCRAGKLPRRQLAGDPTHLKIDPAAAVVAEIKIAAAAVPFGHVIVGLDLGRAGERDHRLAVAAGGGERGAEVVVKQRIVFARYLDRTAVTGDRPLEMFELRERVAQVGPDAGRTRADGQRIAIAPQRVEVAVHRREHDAAGVAQVGIVWIARDRVAQQRLGLGVFAGVVQHLDPAKRLRRIFRLALDGHRRVRHSSPCDGRRAGAVSVQPRRPAAVAALT